MDEETVSLHTLLYERIACPFAIGHCPASCPLSPKPTGAWYGVPPHCIRTNRINPKEDTP